MEQYEVVFKPVKGCKYVVTKRRNGELVVRLVPEKSDAPVELREEQFFAKISKKEREKVKTWLVEQKGKTSSEKAFLKVVKKAIEEVDYDYCIANTEPSVKDDKIYYDKGYTGVVKIANDQWKQMAEDYRPERGSRLASLYELFIWYALRIVENKDAMWTLDKVSNYSTRVFGTDAQVSTIKFVTYGDGYAVVGGNSRSGSAPVEFNIGESLKAIHIDTTAVVVLTK